MPRSSKQPVLLSEMPTFDKESGALQVVIETPKDSRNKYDYDPECNCFGEGLAGRHVVSLRLRLHTLDLGR
jgi:hypothetical protein